MSTLCEYEKVRLLRIAERKSEWDKLVESKKEFDDIGKKALKKSKKQKEPRSTPMILRRSGRQKTSVNYKETPGSEKSKALLVTKSALSRLKEMDYI